jgi:hypothetical protein
MIADKKFSPLKKIISQYSLNYTKNGRNFAKLTSLNIMENGKTSSATPEFGKS